MLHSFFYFVLNMSITAAMITAILLIIRPVFNRYAPKSFVYYMWGIVLFRLIVPVSLPNEFSLINFISGYITKTVPIPKVSEKMPDISVLNSIQAVNEYFPLEYKSRALENIFGISSIVWLCGTVLFIISFIVIYNMAAAELGKAELVKGNGYLKVIGDRLGIKEEVPLYESCFVTSPVVFGVLNPRIIIPKDIHKEVLKFALLHELVHIKRHDNFWRLISILAICIHWFNPFAWLFLYISGQDMELACDEKVLKSAKDDIRKPYANALTSLAAKQQVVLTSFGGTAVKKRIMNIVSYKRFSLIMAVITGTICMVLVVLLITNPVL